MKHLKTFEGLFDFIDNKIKKSEVTQEFTPDESVIKHRRPKLMKYYKKDKDDDNVYAIFTKELLDRKKSQKHLSYAHDAYHFTYSSPERLKELKTKYPVGGMYNGETITSYQTLNGKHIGQ